MGLLLLAVIPSAGAFSLNGYSWPAGSQVTMHLQLERPPVVLQDGSSSWNAVAADALALWNQYLETVSFVQGAGSGPAGDDGANSVFFSNNIYGETFPSGVLAVTLNYSHSGVFTETDVIFNNSIKWNSYRGPIQGSGPSATYDLHRVALHEFGHVLGLDHPDQHGQTVSAIMNSLISDLDAVTADDIAGARSLYQARITSDLFPPRINLGDNFFYQITANNKPTSFGAAPLPPGLQITPESGRISGTPTAAGTFDVIITAHGPVKGASAQLRIIVNGPVIYLSHFPSADVGRNFIYQITASHAASSFEAAGLPAGLSVNPGTGQITGIPTAVGTFQVTLTAHTSFGTAIGTMPLVVLPPRIIMLGSQSPVEVGGFLSYQVSATGQPTSFSASGLPDGVQIDAATGLISGVPTLSGTYQITVFAHTPYGPASTTITLQVTAASLADTPVARFAIPDIYSLVADPQRPRIYAGTFQTLVVIDVPSMSIVKTVTLPFTPWDMSISKDGTRIWVATKSKTLGAIDLEKLEVLPSLSIAEEAEQIREGANHSLFISGFLGHAAQIDPINGAVVAKFNPETHTYVTHCAIEISPDGRTLYVGNLVDVDPRLARYDVSGASPVLLESVAIPFSASSGRLRVSHDGQTVSYSSGRNVTLRAATNLNTARGLSLNGIAGGPLVFSMDDGLAFQPLRPALPLLEGGSIAVYSLPTAQYVRAITLPTRIGAGRSVIDRDNSYLFVDSADGFGPSSRELKVFPVQVSSRTVTPAPKSLLNVSTRLRAEAADNALIAGFIITGLEAKQVVLRGMGPSLPVQGKMADPVLRLHDSTGALIAQNDNWNAHRFDVLATGIPPGHEREAAITTTLQPGAYTAVLRGVNDSAGVALVEAYDLAADSDSKLANISTRGKVEAGDQVMIGGFILGGDQTTTVVVRAIGPSLSNHGVGGALSDPILELHDGNGALFAQNDDWRTDQEGQLLEINLAPIDDREAALLLSLQPGPYTAIVRGKNDSPGVGLVEVYNLE